MKCRHCNAELKLVMCDLGTAPPANAFRESPNGKEVFYPLQVLVCTDCFLVQTNIDLFDLDYYGIFTADYPYYSSTSRSFVEHARQYVEKMTKMLNLGPDSLTVEIGSNDGYLLSHMKTPCYGIEPTQTGEKAKEKGIKTISKFFTETLALELAEDGRADLLVANNVIAHVPDINSFVKGCTALLKPDGVATFEFPHLLKTIQSNDFTQIYSEHFSYLSLTAVKRIFKANGLHIFDVECIPVHGGSLRVYAQKYDGGLRNPTDMVRTILDQEEEVGIKTEKFYTDFQVAAERAKNNLLVFLLQARQLKRTVVAFGAAAKGNTLLNFAGVRSDLIEYVIDQTPSKIGKFLPGSRIEVKGDFDSKPDYIIILPWNFRSEIAAKLEYTRSWGAKLVVAVPRLEIW